MFDVIMTVIKGLRDVYQRVLDNGILPYRQMEIVQNRLVRVGPGQYMFRPVTVKVRVWGWK